MYLMSRSHQCSKRLPHHNGSTVMRREWNAGQDHQNAVHESKDGNFEVMSETRRLRVLYTSHASVVDVYQDKLRHIAASNVDLTVLLPERYLEGTRVVSAFQGDGSYRVITRPTVFGEKGRQNGFFYRGLRSVFRSVQPDILHIEEEPESLVTVQLIRHALRMRRMPGLIGFTWRNWPMPYPHWPFWYPKRILYSLTQQMTLPHLDVLIAGTHDAEAEFRSLGFEGPMPLIPQYGVNPDIYHPPADREALRASHGLQGFVVGFVGRVLQMKGLDVLVDAVAQLTDLPITLVILGNGDYREALERRSAERGITDRVRFVHGIPARDVPGLLGCFDVMVLPSLSAPHWREQFGRVLPEAMACGVPVIGSDSGEIPHVIGNAGLITPEGQPGPLAAAIRRVATDAAFANELRRAGLERVADNYTNEKIAKATVEIYRTLDAKRP